MSSGLSRRDLFRGGAVRAIRPPWALGGLAFTDTCDRCGACVRACPPRIIEKGDGGFPALSFRRGACDFCGDCAAACRSGALRRTDGPAWTLVARVGDGCLSLQGTACRSCADWCTAAAIRFRPLLGGRARPDIDTAACTGCGACVRPCPGAALRMEHHQGEIAECA